MSSLDNIRKPVESELIEFEKHFRNSIDSNVPLLNIITNYILRRKGKQIRPLFVFLSAKLVGEINTSTYVAATLIELLHTATLVHDDVVDESYERRNHFSINAIWKTKIAVLIGDYFLSRGLLAAIDKKEYKLLEIVTEAVKDMSEGELLQIQTSGKSIVSIDNYFEIIRKKTASLIASCTICGAQSVNENGKTREIMKEFGLNAGMAFQIKDDLFDYQKKGIIGKPIGNDIKEKKFTLPLILALRNSDKQKHRHILKLINSKENSLSKTSEVIEFVTLNNGISESEEFLLKYKKKSIESLSYFPDNEAKTSLIQLVDFVINRSN
jgi:octaprenyl-diphosphate synthase